jgi:succinate-semialdehyde dehydrogenase / glutarate-semialdehyde dehydrogenase
MISINPYNGEVIQKYSELNPTQLELRLNHAQAAYSEWRFSEPSLRRNLLKNLNTKLLQNKEEYARMITLEMGKTYVSAISEIEKSAWLCSYYADNFESLLSDEWIETEAAKSYVCFRPLGTILIIMPWNFPFWQVLRAAVPALAAGNTVLLKHASNVQGCAYLLESLLIEAGFPIATMQNLCISASKVADVLSDKRIHGVSLTGSYGAGSSVASLAGSHIKKAVLELGGSDPYIVLADANLDHAVNECVAGRILNSGQSCIGAKRFIVQKEVFEKFLNSFIQAMSEIRVGDPFDENTDMGPMAKHDLRNELHEQVLKSVSLGAKIRLGGLVPNHKAAFYSPTVLTEIKPGMPAYEEEVFGPVASVFCAESEEQAFHIANDTLFGLGASIFSNDVERAEQLGKNYIESGTVFINGMVKSDPRLPFGGIKESGFGREMGQMGIKEFVNAKTMVVTKVK